MTHPYNYDLPPELLAHTPIEPRDASRLLVVDAKGEELSEDVFKNIADYLPEGALLVMNDTKVVPARVIAKKDTGGKVELLFLVNEWRGEDVPAISDRKLVIGQKVFLDNDHSVIVAGQNENIFLFRLQFPRGEFFPLLDRVGETPIPRYIGDTKMGESVLRERYQSVLASNPASIAAPTASLHFTEAVFESLKKKGIEIARVTLHVGLGTFAPVGEKEISEGKLHEEYYEISKESVEAIRMARKEGRPVVAVGTTVVRALESANHTAPCLFDKQETCITFCDDRHKMLYMWEEGVVRGETRMFIRPPYEFKIVDQLITNFHLPESSLMYLVDAFLQNKQSGQVFPRHDVSGKKRILDIYESAIARRFRFYSFGDAMLIR